MKEIIKKHSEVALPFGIILKRILEEKKVPMLRLSKLAKMSERHVQMLVSGEREPRFRTILRIEIALELEPGTLSREVLDLMPDDWAVPAEEDKTPKKGGRPKKVRD